MQMQSTKLLEADRKQAEWAITAAAWGGLATADRISIWASIHARDMMGTNGLELRLLGDQPFFAPDVGDDRTLQCTYCRGGCLSFVRRVPLPTELCGLWFTLIGLSTDSVYFRNPAIGAAHARLEICAKKLVVAHYAEHASAFSELYDDSVLEQAKLGW